MRYSAHKIGISTCTASPPALFLLCTLPAAAPHAAPHSATVTYAFDEAGATIAHGSFTYPDSITGQLTYEDLTAFTFQIGNGTVYDLAYVDSGNLSVYRDFGYDTVSQNFVTTNLYGYPQILSGISNDFDTGFFVRFDNTYKEVDDYAGSGIQPIDQILITPTTPPSAQLAETAVPEPAPLGLFIAGLATLATLHRRRF